MAIESDFQEMRKERLSIHDRAVPQDYQGVTKERIRQVLIRMDQNDADNVDVVFSLLDNIIPNQFSGAPYRSKFCAGATVAHIGSHVGILQRGGDKKLDREGRDKWIKPLRDLGAIDPIYFSPETNTFIEGHPKAKSPNSAYRLNSTFCDILKASESDWEKLLSGWLKEDRVRERAALQAEAQIIATQLIGTDHKNLIMVCKDIYVPNFLPDYKILFVDFEDGQRVTDDEQKLLAEADISIVLDDPMPDILLWNPNNDYLWIIEAVTSDGEVDLHKVNQVLSMVERNNKSGAGFTTAYISWIDAAKRQGRYKNIAPSTYIWVSEDPSKHFLVTAMDHELMVRGLK
ncbi:MAG: BsuBI/PstI family type II restriction endonuclease [Anaerolineales bacterium]